jgi:PIN domain nuclease of toxin-antitoxin system
MGSPLRLLLDTHTFYWWWYEKTRLTPRATATIKDCETAYVSLVSYWELAIKVRAGKLKAEGSLSEGVAGLASEGFDLLPIEYQHVYGTLHLPLHHRDPFDRLLIAQALSEGLAIVSGDAALDRYGVERIW